jgi:hypothetical protein
MTYYCPPIEYWMVTLTVYNLMLEVGSLYSCPGVQTTSRNVDCRRNECIRANCIGVLINFKARGSTVKLHRVVEQDALETGTSTMGTHIFVVRDLPVAVKTIIWRCYLEILSGDMAHHQVSRNDVAGREGHVDPTKVTDFGKGNHGVIDLSELQ